MVFEWYFERYAYRSKYNFFLIVSFNLSLIVLCHTFTTDPIECQNIAIILCMYTNHNNAHHCFIRIYWHNSYISHKSAYHWSVSLFLVFGIKHSEDLPLRENLWDTVQNTIARAYRWKYHSSIVYRWKYHCTVYRSKYHWTVYRCKYHCTVYRSKYHLTVYRCKYHCTVYRSKYHWTFYHSNYYTYRSKYNWKKYPSQLNGIPVIIIPLNGPNTIEWYTIEWYTIEWYTIECNTIECYIIQCRAVNHSNYRWMNGIFNGFQWWIYRSKYRWPYY